MRLVTPKPFTFEGGKRAVLFLHGFTGNSADCRMLARFLQKKGYTCHGIQYKGHGVPPEELIKFGPDDWWEDVLEGYEFLKDQGYNEIAVGGLSLGGVFSLKLGYTYPIKGIISMATPMYEKNDKVLNESFLKYVREYKKAEGKSDEQINQEMETFTNGPLQTLTELRELFTEVRNHVDEIYAPTFVAQGRHDHMVDAESANIIYNNIQSDLKVLKWYEQSGHVLTLDKERDLLHEDVYQFLEQLDWEE